MKSIKKNYIVTALIFLIILISFWYVKESKNENLIFVNLNGGGWDPVELKINGKLVEIFLSGATEVSTYCQKGTNKLSIEGKWEETKYLNEVHLGVKIYEGVNFFNENGRIIFEKNIIRDEKKPMNLSVTYDFIL